MGDILKVLETLRVPSVMEERELHRLIASAFDENGIAYAYEAKIAPRCRVDFLCEGGVAIEVKRGKPQYRALLAQLRRYAACDAVSALILVVERNANIPSMVEGKPCVLFGLNRLWGVAI